MRLVVDGNEKIVRSGKNVTTKPREKDHKRPPRKPWSIDEVSKLAELHKIFGNDWSTIVQYLPGRSITAAEKAFRKKVVPQQVLTEEQKKFKSENYGTWI